MINLKQLDMTNNQITRLFISRHQFRYHRNPIGYIPIWIQEYRFIDYDEEFRMIPFVHNTSSNIGKWR